MTDDDPPTDDRAHELSCSALKVAHEIADWCEAKRIEASTAADKQIQVVWMLLLGGLLLLLVLPRVIQEIDYAWRKSSLPPEILQTAERTIASVERNRQEMESDVRAAETQRDSITAEISTVEKARTEAEAAYKALMIRPFSSWRITTLESPGSRIDLKDTVVGSDAGMIAVGSESDDKSVVPIILQSTGGVEWSSPPIPADGEASDQSISITSTSFHSSSQVITLLDGMGFAGFSSVALSEGGELIAALDAISGTAIVSSEDGWDWRAVWLGEEDSPSRRLVDIAKEPNGTFYAAGFSAVLGSRTQFLLQTADSVWTLSEDVSNFAPVEGSLAGILPLNDGRIMVAGSETTQEESEFLTTLVTDDGSNWTRTRPQVDGKDVAGQAFALEQTSDGTLLLGYHTSGSSGVIRSRDGRTWKNIEFTGADIDSGAAFTTILPTPDGHILIAAFESTRSGSRLVMLTSSDAENWRANRYETAGAAFSPTINGMAATRDGRVVAVGDGTVMTSLLPAEIEVLGESPENMTVETADVVVPDSAAVRVLEFKRNIDRRNQLSEQQAQQQAFLDTAVASYERQETALAEVGQLATELEKSLRASEPFRQVAQTATRLAVIGLLIYLVQIVVNRYRYLQRLSGFYQARAQALRLFAASPESGLLQGVSLADLTTMLSPDAIGFDKSADPPTSQMVSLLQAGLRKT